MLSIEHFSKTYPGGKRAMDDLCLTVQAGEITSAQVVCQITNTKVMVEYAPILSQYFSNYETTVSNTSGSLLYTRDEYRAGYFAPEKLHGDVRVAPTYARDLPPQESACGQGCSNRRTRTPETSRSAFPPLSVLIIPRFSDKKKRRFRHVGRKSCKHGKIGEFFPETRGVLSAVSVLC